MFVITITEFKKLIGHTVAVADKQPVFITKSNKPRCVLLSYDEYNRMVQNQKDYVAPVEQPEVPNPTPTLVLEKPKEYVEQKMDMDKIAGMTIEQILSLHGTAWND